MQILSLVQSAKYLAEEEMSSEAFNFGHEMIVLKWHSYERPDVQRITIGNTGTWRRH